MKAKVLAMMMTAVLTAGVLAGCGQSDTAEQENQQQESAEAAVDEADKEDVKNGEGKDYKIGIIQPMDHTSLNQIYETIVEELNAQGYTDIVYKNANGDQTVIPTIIQDMISDGVDMLIPIATGPAQAVASAKVDVPVVFSAVSNPVEAGLVTSFEDTTGGITGVSNSIPVEQIFEMAQELTPDVKTYGFVYNSSEVNAVSGIEKAKAYCDEHGIAYKEATITGTADIQQAASSLVGEVDAFFTPNDNTVASAMPVYTQVAYSNHLPLYVGADSMVLDGGLATVGIDYTVLGKQTADMAVRIAGGEKVEDNPVEQIAEYAKMINMETADTLGISISDELKAEFQILGE